MNMRVKLTTPDAPIQQWNVYDGPVRIAVVVRHPFQVLQSSELNLNLDQVRRLIDAEESHRGCLRGGLG